MFQSDRLSAGFGKNAYRARDPDPVRKGRVKMLHVNPADILLHPFIENGDEELSICPRFHRTFADQVAFIYIERPVAARAFAPP